MKKLVILTGLSIVLLSSCLTQKQPPYTDDVYSNPKEVREEEARLAAAEKQAQDAREKRYKDSVAAVKQAQKEKDDANPYYKDREFKYDDYYDYEYATRIRRFDRRIDGLSYYDNYYTNAYWYTYNPYYYGVSVYNGYTWWGPSYNYYSYSPSISFYSSWGWGCSPYSGYYGYNPYSPYSSGYWLGYHNGYQNGYYNGWNGYPYSGFGYGSPYYGYGGWNNPYNNGWGYYNSYDMNSSYSYGPRTSHEGGNARRGANPGMDGPTDPYYNNHFAEVEAQRNQTSKFSDLRQVRRDLNSGVQAADNDNNTPNGTGGVRPVSNPGNTGNQPIRNANQPTRQPIRDVDTETGTSNPNGNTGGIKSPNHQQQQAPVKENTAPVRNTNPVKNVETRPKFDAAPVRDDFFKPSSTPSNGGGSPGNNGGGGRSTPSSGGGGHRPR